MRIGVLDWGVGGCGLVSKLKDSGLETVYFSDSGYEPYGKVTELILRERVHQCLKFLESQHVDLIAVACNAASSVIKGNDSLFSIIDCAQSMIHELPTNQSIGVIGGNRLVDSNLLSSVTFPDHKIKQAVAQKLSAHIEAGNQASIEAVADLKIILSELGPIDHLILACTHYSAMQNQIKQIIPDLIIHDPVNVMAENIKNRFTMSGGQVKNIWFTTGSKVDMIKASKLAFNVDISHADQIIL